LFDGQDDIEGLNIGGKTQWLSVFRWCLYCILDRLYSKLISTILGCTQREFLL